MFGFGNKKKIKEFTHFLSDLGDISIVEANAYVSANENEINSAFKRGLDPFAAVAYISEKQMERIRAAHHLGNLELASAIEDFWLLVALHCVVAMENAGVPSAQIDFNFQHWNSVIDMPTSPESGDETYGDRLEGLVDAAKANKS